MWYESIVETVGRTPLVRLWAMTADIPCTVLAKVEYFNPGGSVKDRIGITMIEAAERDGLLKPGGTIIECTSGNTGAGIALVAIQRGYRCIFTTTDKQSREKINVLRALGAEVIVCPTNVAPEDPRSYYAVAARLNEEIPNSFHANQYDNPANAEAHYLTTGPELWDQTDGRITHFIAGAGTGGTISGTARYLKEQDPGVKVIGVDPMGSVYFKYWHTREFDENEVYPYFTEGVGEDILAGNMDFDMVDDYVRVDDAESLQTARRMAREEGLFTGGSCGMAVAGALQWLRAHRSELKPDDVVVVLLPDSGFRYLSKLYDDTWMQDHGFLRRDPGLSAAEVLESAGRHEVLAATPDDSLAQAIRLMTDHGVSQLPVISEQSVLGSLSETGILNRLIEEPEARERPVKDIMDAPFPIVSSSLPIDQLSGYLERSNSAVLVKREASGEYDIITKTDLIRALAASGGVQSGKDTNGTATESTQ